MSNLSQFPAPAFDPLDPYPWFAWMRLNARVWQDPGTQVWYVFGYHDVLSVLNPPLKPSATDPIVFSSQLPSGPERPLTQGSIIGTDPPRQRAVREVLTQAFSPRVLQEQYASRITALIDGLLDQVLDAETMDAVTLAYEIPVLVISEMLGVPTADRETFKRWTNQTAGRVEVQDTSVVTRQPELEQYFLHTLEQRRQQNHTASADLISILVHGCPGDGVALSQQELLGNCELLLLAGFETTAHLLTNLFRVLGTFPQMQEQVWQTPALCGALIEETLRYLSPVHIQGRWTTQAVEIGGKTIPAHQQVMPLLGSANRDEEVFPRADAFDLLRFAHSAPTHVAFGFRGTHFCLGAPLARLEASLLLQRLIARLRQIRLIPGIPLQAIRTEGLLVPMVNGVRSLPVTFKRR